MTNPILNTDSYKPSQFLQSPEGTEFTYSYVEARGYSGPLESDSTVFFGLQAALLEYLSVPITQEDIEEADLVLTAHGEPFNREGWQYILDEYAGFMPVRIKAIPEGTIAPLRTVLATVENIDPKCFWVTSYIETMLLRAIWYPTTVASNSWNIKQDLKNWIAITSDEPESIAFKLHDFGARGVSSQESASLGGMAHLVNFMGTDTIAGLLAAKRYYDEDMAGFSIPASEHSTMTIWGLETEQQAEAFGNMLDKFGKDNSMFACVSDSKNILEATYDIWGGILRDKVIAFGKRGGTVVVRPDSGDPVATPVKVVELLARRFGTTTNSKGYKVLNRAVRVIQGDGVNRQSIDLICGALAAKGFSVDNIAFGMGGAMLQQLDRDTYNFAMKQSSAVVNGEARDVTKRPVGSVMKASFGGRVESVIRDDEIVNTIPETKLEGDIDLMEVVWEAGTLLRKQTFAEVRENSNK